jgi:radical SAM superfamily enzyme YgiQ (UPF0313 family)
MWSDTFTANKTFVMALAKAIEDEKLGIEWMCNSRVDTLDEEMVRAMKASGCRGISFGIESADQVVLNTIKKGIQVSQIEKAITLTNRYGIESLAHIIFGLPGDSEAAIKKTIRFVKKIKPTYAQFYCAIPFPGTVFYEQALANHWLTTRDWSQYEINQAIVTTANLNAPTLSRLRKMAYIRFYFSPGYLWRRLSKVRSFQELRTNIGQGFDFMKSWVWERARPST